MVKQLGILICAVNKKDMTVGKNKQPEDLDKLIISFVRERKPRTVEDLIEMILEKRSFSREEIIYRVLMLKSKGKLSLKETKKFSSLGFLFSSNYAWFWIVTILAFSTTIAVTSIPENAFPFVYIRYVLGSLYIFFLPGYSFMRAVFFKRELDRLEQIVFSVILSVTFVFFAAFLLNYTHWGVTLIPIVLILLAITLLSAIVSLLREHGILMADMAKKFSKRNRFTLFFWIGAAFLVIGLGIWLYTDAVIRGHEQLLSGDLTPEERARVSGSLTWWEITRTTLYNPLSIILIAIGVLCLIYAFAWIAVSHA
ncbi:MAG: DUF1616 domain-containing protein [Candidatus Ranarchaeia archaeon]